MKPGTDFFETEVSHHAYFEPALYRALVTCLSPNDKCRMLKANMEQGPYERRVVLSLITEDMRTTFEPSHERLVEELLSQLCQVNGTRAQSVAYCLKQILEAAPETVAARIVGALVSSRFKGVRDRAGWAISRNWHDGYLPILRDFAPGQLGVSLQAVYIDNENLDVLFEKRHTLVSAVTDVNRSRLYRRLVGRHPAVLKELRQIDPVSYVYIAAKEGIQLEASTAYDIARDTYGCQKFGLVIWSLGRLKMWPTLVQICRELVDWERTHIGALAAKYDVEADEAYERLRKK